MLKSQIEKQYKQEEREMNEQHNKYQKAKEQVAALRGFYGHLVVYLVVNLGLFLINMTTSRGSLWFYWPLMGWGIAIILHLDIQAPKRHATCC